MFRIVEKVMFTGRPDVYTGRFYLIPSPQTGLSEIRNFDFLFLTKFSVILSWLTLVEMIIVQSLSSHNDNDMCTVTLLES